MSEDVRGLEVAVEQGEVEVVQVSAVRLGERCYVLHVDTRTKWPELLSTGHESERPRTVEVGLGDVNADPPRTVADVIGPPTVLRVTAPWDRPGVIVEPDRYGLHVAVWRGADLLERGEVVWRP